MGKNFFKKVHQGLGVNTSNRCKYHKKSSILAPEQTKKFKAGQTTPY